MLRPPLSLGGGGQSTTAAGADLDVGDQPSWFVARTLLPLLMIGTSKVWMPSARLRGVLRDSFTLRGLLGLVLAEVTVVPAATFAERDKLVDDLRLPYGGRAVSVPQLTACCASA
jgi:hypothetical protein